MPHSNDGTVVTCAGDSEVRVFDLEYSGAAQTVTDTSASSRSRRFHSFFPNAKWLTEANTNARIYRSHADRAKRIVTESSPYLFLSCSEDGEVRQWDLRQPSSFYPPPRDGRSYVFRRPPSGDATDDVPPPLISYKSYGLDLNSISCTGSQPHYIALGGAHLHCFLHDRRMLGRNLDAEQGRPASSKPMPGTAADESMREATKCVRRFAPNNKRKMRPGNPGHITACKISDARPNELISSWSGDLIYSFDIVKSPDARDEETRQDALYRTARLTNKTERKRKRTKGTASTISVPDGAAANGRRLRRVSDSHPESGQTALQVRYDNGDTEQIDVSVDPEEGRGDLVSAHATLLSEAQKQSENIARALVRLRKTLFDFSSILETNPEVQPRLPTELTLHTPQYTSALGEACALLSSMDTIMKEWKYPNTTDQDEILLQNALRRNRQASWRFVQAAGCLARTLGGTLQTSSDAEDPRMSEFEAIRPASREALRIDERARFCYDFIKAITLWLDGGKAAVVAGFKRPPWMLGDTERFPFDDSVTVTNLPEKLRAYLLPLALDDRPVIDLGRNQFERDELRQLFENQKIAVHGFIRALDQIEELRMHQGTSDIIQETSGGVKKRIMDKGAAARYWGEKVARALLMDAAEGVTFNFVNRAFGGLKVHVTPDDGAIDRLIDEAMSEEEDAFADVMQGVTTTTQTTTEATVETRESRTTPTASGRIPRVIIEDVEDDDVEEEEEEEEEDNIPDQSDDEGSNSEDDDDADDETSLLHNLYRPGRRMFGGGSLSAQRASVNSNVPYTSHTKVYSGHCNTRTVKDVNYYGLDDEYVVSGSDDGHFFIWDRKTCDIVSVFEGDGEVVNVVQGHPYEPMIACSGIDSTIKIFGPGGDSRERFHARQGFNIANPGGGRHSSLGLGPGRRRRMRVTDDDNSDNNDAEREAAAAAKNAAEEEAARIRDLEENPDAVAKGGLRSRRVPADRISEIASQNNTERRHGVGEAYMTVSDAHLDVIFLRAWIMSNAMVT